jgi:hypothetical protein
MHIHKFPKYYMKVLLGNLKAKVGRIGILKSTAGKESLHNIRNDNGIKSSKLCNIQTSRSKVQCSHSVTFINVLDIS